MKARSVLLAAGISVMGFLFVLRLLTASGGGPSALIFRSSEDLFSMQRLLSDEASFSELASFCDTMALWNVFSSSEAAPEGMKCVSPSQPDGPSVRIRHRFELASQKAVSSRVYQIDFVTCRQGPGEYTIEANPVGFRSNFSRNKDPVLTSFHALSVFKLAINDLDVAGDLVKMLQDRPITYLSVTAEQQSPGPPTDLFFHFVAADRVPTEAGSHVIRYLAEYNPVTKSAVFTPEGDGSG